MIGGIYRLFLAASLIVLVSGGGLTGKRLQLADQSPNLNEGPEPKVRKVDKGAPGSGASSMLGLKRYKILPYGDMLERGIGKRSVRAVDTQTGQVVMIRCQWGHLWKDEMRQSAILQELNSIGYRAVPRWLGAFSDENRACTVIEYPNGVLTSDLGEYELKAEYQRSALKAILVALEQLPWLGGPSSQLVPRVAFLTEEGIQFLEFNVISIAKPSDYSLGARALQRTAAEMFRSSPADRCRQEFLRSLDRDSAKPFASQQLSLLPCIAQASNDDFSELLSLLPLTAYELIDSTRHTSSSGSPDSCQAYLPNDSNKMVDVDIYQAESLKRNSKALGRIAQLDHEFVQTPLDVLPWGEQIDVIYAESIPSVAYHLNMLRDQPAQHTQDYLLGAMYAAVSALSLLHQNGLYLNAGHPESELDSALVYEVDDQYFKLRLRPDRLRHSLEGRTAAMAVERDLLTLHHYANRLRGLCTDPEVGGVLDDLLSRIAMLHADGDFDGATRVAAYFSKRLESQ